MNLDAIIDRCSEYIGQLTGADWYSLCADAFTCAACEIIEKREKGVKIGPDELLDESMCKKNDSPLIIHQRHFISAVAKLKPSVSKEELARFKEIQSSFK